MGSQSSKLVTDAQKHEHAINYMNSGGSMSDKSDKAMKETEGNSANHQEMVNTCFKWNFGGQKVFVTGTFTGWKSQVPLQREKGGEFSIVIPLPKNIHYYKFIVDGDWRFSPDDPTLPDECGNINNMIDTTKTDAKVKDVMDSSQRFRVDKIREDSQQQVTKQQPAQDLNFSEKAPPVPPHLLKFYYLEEKDKRLQKMWNKEVKTTTMNKNGMELENQPQLSQQETFDNLIQIFSNVNSLSPPPHVCLNHLANLNSNSKNTNAYPYNVYSLTHRFKAKYTTIKFYTHKYGENKQQLFVV